MRPHGHWGGIAYRLCHAFQPIASLHDGSAFGFEALLRGWEELGFSSIQEVFDAAHEEGILHEFDLALRAKAFRAFAAAPVGNAKLFYNIDTRLLEMPSHCPDETLRIAEDAGLPATRIVLEVSERLDPAATSAFDSALATYKGKGFRIALDDFGSGYAGLKLLHRAGPDLVKIDRYFVADIDADPRKAAFMEKMVGLAHLMGLSVVAEGVENEEVRRLCADAGADYLQGFHVARPCLDTHDLRRTYQAALPSQDRVWPERRANPKARSIPEALVSPIEALAVDGPLTAILARFRKGPGTTVVPVVDGEGEPLGIYRERDFREYVYSPFGISLLEHAVQEGGPGRLLVKAAVLPLGSDLGRVVTAYGSSKEAGCVILTEGGRYAGLIPAEEILGAVAERDLSEARDQNPLTRLPGNLRIAEVCAEHLKAPGRGVAFAYYDFDNFKPFNDRYGFRSGDRVIMLFADILKSTFTGPGDFVGHLGGDDFFVCSAAWGSLDTGDILKLLRDPADRLAREATSFYAPEDRERGWVPGKGRDGAEIRMSLLGASLALVHLRPGANLSSDGLAELLARQKRLAKASPERVAVAVVPPA